MALLLTLLRALTSSNITPSYDLLTELVRYDYHHAQAPPVGPRQRTS